MIKSSLHRGKVSQGLALIIANGLFFGMIDPTRAPSLLFMVAFLLAGLSVYWLASNLYQLAMWYGVPLKHQRRAVISVTACLMGVIALQSMGQLGTRDMVLLLPFAVVGYFYISYQQRHSPN